MLVITKIYSVTSNIISNQELTSQPELTLQNDAQLQKGKDQIDILQELKK